MLSGLQIEALTHGCAACGASFNSGAFVHAVYFKSAIRNFEKQIEIGIIGATVRNFWVHASCTAPSIGAWSVVPDIHTCVRCKQRLQDKHIIVPVFQIVKARAVNPNDPTDVGVELGDRVYFMHADCKNGTLDKQSSNILIV